VHVGILAQVEAAEMEAEDRHRATQRREAIVGDERRAVRAQRGVDDGEIGGELVGPVVRRQRRVRGAARHLAREPRCGRGKPRVHAAQRAAVRLVLPERRLVLRRVGQREQRGRRRHEPRRHRQLDGEPIQLGEVVRERLRRLTLDGVAHDVGGDERIAVAVPADPRSHAQHGMGRRRRVGPVPRQLADEDAVHLRHLLEQREVVVAERLVDLVAQPQAREPQHRGLPEQQDLPPQRQLPRVALLADQHGAVGTREEPHDLALRVEHGLAAHLGRMRGDDGRHERVGQQLGDARPRDAVALQAIEREAQAAGLRRRARELVVPPAPRVVHVLGDVREQVEEDRRADRVQRVPLLQDVEPRRHRVPTRAVATGRHGLPARRLDQLEDARPGLLADHLAEDAPEEPDVVAERGFLLALLLVLGGHDVQLASTDVAARPYCVKAGRAHSSERCSAGRAWRRSR
jgi:hypothetical protein